MDKIRVLLLGMTGFGNNAMSVLRKDRRVELQGVITPRRKAGAYPYYKCRPLHEAASAVRVEVVEGVRMRSKSTDSLIRSMCPDIIVVSTFNQIIPDNIISVPRLGVINVHPSLLPEYRGATPTVWTLVNGEKETGVTVHFIEDKSVDTGRIITQSRLKIGLSETDGELRKRLGKLAEKALSRALGRIMRKKRRDFARQDEKCATYFPKRTPGDGRIDLNASLSDISNKIRAFLPFPGAYLYQKGKQYFVTGVRPAARSYGPGRGMKGKELIMETGDGLARFLLRRC